MDINELLAITCIIVVSFSAGYLLCDLHHFKRYIKERCIK